MSIGRVPGATGIQPSIVTAKGDLIVATASGSVTNQAVGSNNQVLMADSAQADGVKWANEATATLTTTGDLLYASAANTPARLAIGSTNQVLTVSGGVPTWATPSSGPTLVGCSLYTSTGFSISNDTYTNVNWDSEVFDTDSFHSTSSNTSRVTIPSGKGGKYQVTVRIPWDYANTGYRRVVIKKDGSSNVRFEVQAAPQVNTTSAGTVTMSTVMQVTAGEYYEVELYQNKGGTLGTFGGIAWGEWTWIYLGA